MSFISSDPYDEFPSKTYHKYKSQCKTNPLYNKLNNDSGYPQDILANSGCILKRKNYLSLNKQNLKNFFSERLPPRAPSIQKESITIDPSTIFQIKRKQYQLKSQTKINLHKTIDINESFQTSEIQKINQNFYVNDKNRDFRKKFLESENRTIQPYETENYRKGTKSYVQKYSKVLKKQAYDKVFGPDISVIPGKDIRKFSQTLREKRTVQTSKGKKPFSKDENLGFERRRKFSMLIKKLDGYRKDFDPENKAGITDYVPYMDENEQPHQSDMITWIQGATKFYKGQNLQRNAEKLENLEDIKKLDSNFYEEMNQHKKSRQRNREYMLNKQRLQSSNAFQSKLTDQFEQTVEKNVEFNLHESRESQSILSKSEKNSQMIYFPLASEYTIEERFQRLGRLLAHCIYKAKFFGMHNKSNIYSAFWKKTPPYELQGSYAFFTSIKNGDIVGMKYFINQNDDYLYQQDHKGRSPLTYATVHEHHHVVKFLLQYDINLDHVCKKKKTALFYALKNKNKDIVKELLLNGSSPWSTADLPYYALSKDEVELERLLKNARKVHLGVLLHETKGKKLKFWEQNRQKINQNEIIQFI